MAEFPQKFGPFTLMRRLDSQESLPEFVAILDNPPGKRVVARRTNFSNPEAGKALADQIDQFRKISHPNLIRIISTYEDKDQYYVLEDRSDMVALDTFIRWQKENNRRISPTVFIHLAIQACRGLSAIHKVGGPKDGLLHSRLSPATLFIDRQGTLKIGRFPFDTTSRFSTSTTFSSEPNQLAYLAPEQTSASQTIQCSADIFSLAAILYELWTLQPIFIGDSALQTLQRIRTGQVTAQLSQVRESFLGLDQIFYRALSLNPRHRYLHAFVMKEDLQGLMASFSFVNISEEINETFRPIFDHYIGTTPELATGPPSESTSKFLRELAPSDAQNTLAEHPESPALLRLPDEQSPPQGWRDNYPELTSQTDSEEDTAALLRDLSLLRDVEQDYSPPSSIGHDTPTEPPFDLFSGPDSLVPMEILESRGSDTAPIERPHDDAVTDVMKRRLARNQGETEDSESTVIGGRGDTVPIPRPLEVSIRGIGNEELTSSHTNDDILLDLPIATPKEGSLPPEQARSQTLPILMLVLIPLGLVCSGTLITLAWLF